MIGAIVGIIVAGGLAVNQVTLQKEINYVSTHPPVVVRKEVIITNTPTASPTATLRTYYVPRRTVTVAPTK